MPLLSPEDQEGGSGTSIKMNFYKIHAIVPKALFAVIEPIMMGFIITVPIVSLQNRPEVIYRVCVCVCVEDLVKQNCVLKYNV